MWEHLIVAWRSGLRSRSFHALFVLGILVMCGAYLAAQFSGRQPATVALDVGISGVRFIILLLTVFWCQELVARELERRTVFFALAYPAPRSHYLLGRYLGVLGLLAAAMLVLGVLLSLTTFFASKLYGQSSPVNLGFGLWLTLSYIWLDAAVVAAFTVFITSFSTTPLLPLALGLAFAVAARSLGPALEYLRNKDEGDAELSATLSPIVENLRWVLPDLSRLDIRVSALYGQIPSSAVLLIALVMCIAYSIMLVILANWIFRKRQFA
jgi:Cu-processing system permease protein